MAKTKVKKCQTCKVSFSARRDAKTCSATCRKRLQRALQSEAKKVKKDVKKFEANVEQEFQRLAGGLLTNHVALEAIELSDDERGSVQVMSSAPVGTKVPVRAVEEEQTVPVLSGSQASVHQPGQVFAPGGKESESFSASEIATLNPVEHPEPTPIPPSGMTDEINLLMGAPQEPWTASESTLAPEPITPEPPLPTTEPSLQGPTLQDGLALDEEGLEDKRQRRGFRPRIAHAVLAVAILLFSGSLFALINQKADEQAHKLAEAQAQWVRAQHVLAAQKASFNKLYAKELTADKATIGNLTVSGVTNLDIVRANELTANSSGFTNMWATNASITNLQVSNLNATNADIHNGFIDNLTVNGSSTTGGNQTVSGNQTVNGNLVVKGTTNLQGAVTLNSTLNVAGATVLNSTLRAGGTTLDSLTVINNATIGGTLGVSGATTLSSTLQAGATTLSSLNVTNNATVGGTLAFNTFGTADNANFVCRNALNQLSLCTVAGSGAAFVQDGNSFGQTAVLGTNDGFNLEIETAGTTKATLTTAGQLQLANSGSSAGITIGGDTNLYRSAANVLKTDDTLDAVGQVRASINGGASVIAGDIGGGVGGLVIGPDTNLYRSAANTLKTDDAFIVGDNLQVGLPVNLTAGNGFNNLDVVVKQSAVFTPGSSYPGFILQSNANDSFFQLVNNGSAFKLTTDYASTGSYQPIDITPGGGANVLLANGSGKVGINATAFGTNNKLLVNAYSIVDNLATAQINTNAATNKGLVVQGFAGQTADLQQWQDSTGAVLAKVNSAGDLTAHGYILSGNGSASSLPALQGAGGQRIWSTATGGWGIGNTGGAAQIVTNDGTSAVGLGTSAGTVQIARGTTSLWINPVASATRYIRYDNGASSELGYVDNNLGQFYALQNAGTVGLQIRGAAAQTANLLQFQRSDGAVLSWFDNIGALHINTGVEGANPGIIVSGDGTAPVDVAAVYIQTRSTDRKGIVVRGQTSQIDDLLQLQNSSGTALSKIDATGDLLAGGAATATTGTTTGTGTNTTTLTLTSDAFAVNDVVLIDNAGQDYYTRITVDPGTGSYTVDPAVTFETARTVTKYTIQNIGATTTDYTTQANRFFQGSFLGQVTVGAGTTKLSDGQLLLQSDTNLYRSAADTLKTDDNFIVGGNLTVQGSSTYTGSLLPSADDTYDLGSAAFRWRDLYLGPTSLHIQSTAAETTTARDYAWAIQETDGATEGNLRLTLGGSDLVNITPGGNVGIGVTDPHEAKLYLNGTTYSNAGASDTVYNGNVYGGAGLNFIGSGGYWAQRTATNNSYNLDVYNGGSPRTALTALQNGNVGIGTTLPAQKLHVGAGNILLDNNQYLRLKDTSGTEFDAVGKDSGNNFVARNAAASGSAYYGNSNVSNTGGDLIFQTKGANVGMFDQDGNLGIGTTAPTFLLDVRKNQAGYTLVNVDNSNAAASGTGEGYSISESGSTVAALRAERDTTGTLNLINGGNGPLNFQTGASYGAATTKLSIAAAGAILAKNGTNSTTAFQIQNANASTTLFAADTTNTKISVTGTLNNTGGGNFSALSTPAAPTVTPQGTTGATSYSYAVSARNANGGETPVSANGSTATGNATLDATNFNRITWTAVAGAKDYRIYRTASGGTPASTGLVGTVTTGSTLQFDDTGIAGGAAANTVDASGNVGIGETNPTAKLQFAASTSATGGIQFGTDTNLYRSAANTLKTDDALTATGNLTGQTDVFAGGAGTGSFTANAGIAVDSQVQVGWEGSYGARIKFGSDTNLYRSAANVLKTDDDLHIGSSISTSLGRLYVDPTAVGLSSSVDAAIALTPRVAGAQGLYIRGLAGQGGSLFYVQDSALGEILNLNPNGQLAISKQTGSTAGLVIGGDTNLYRAGANQLKTDDSFYAGGDIYTQATGGSAQALFGDIFGTGKSGITFGYGSANNANLYRDSADTLKTDDNFIVGGTLTVSGSSTFTGSLLPSADDTYDLGSSAFRWRDLYLGPTSLHIQSTAAETTTARDYAWAIQETDGATEGNLRLTLGGSDLVNITPGGNVGIGTTGPAKPLDVVSNGSAYGIYQRGRASDNFGTMSFGPNAGGTSYFDIQAGPSTFDIRSGTAVSYLMVNNGKIGIRDTDPSTTLSVGGTGSANGITLGDDQASPANLYHSAANTLKTDDDLLVDGDLSSNNRIISDANGANRVKLSDGKAGIDFGSGDDTNLYRNGASELKTDDAFIVQPGVNTTTAFQVQNAAGANLVQVDTTADSVNLVTNGSLEVNTTGWTARGSSTLTRSTAQQYIGLASLSVATTAAANDGAKYAVTLASTTQYTLTLFAKASGSNFSTFEIGRADDGVTDTSCLTAQTVTTAGWTRFTCTFTTGTVSGSPYVYAKQTDATARTFFLDAVKVEAAASATPYREGLLSLNGNISSPITLKNQSDSTRAFEIQNAAGTSNLLIADTLSTRLGIGGPAANALLTIGTNTTTAAGGLIFGTDTNLYRSAANTLKTDDTLVIGGGFQSLQASEVFLNSAGGQLALNRNANVGFGTGGGLNLGGLNSASATFVQAAVEAVSGDVTAGSETGSLVFKTRNLGTLAEKARITDVGQLQLSIQGSTGGLQIGTDTNLYRSAADTLKTDDAFQSGAHTVFGGFVATGSGEFRSGGAGQVIVAQDGTNANILFGLAGDTNLYRGAADTLKTDDAFQAIGSITAGQFITASNGSAAINLTATTGSPGITIGGDTNLYRAAANVLKTDDRLQLAGGIDLLSDDGNDATGIRFGSVQDTNLYRSAANTLKTDDSLVISSPNASKFEVRNSDAGLRLQVADSGLIAAGAGGYTNGTYAASGGFRFAGDTGNGALSTEGNLQLESRTAATDLIFRPAATERGRLTSAGQLQLSAQGSTGGLLIGTDTNLYRSAADTLRTDDNFQAVSTSGFGNQGAIDANNVINLSHQFTGTSGTLSGIYARNWAVPSGASSAAYRGIYGEALIDSSIATNLTGSAQGVSGSVLHNGTGTLSTAIGIRAGIDKGNTGPLTDAYGVYVHIRNTNATNAIQNAYGLYIEDSTETGAITNDYGIYQVDNGALNYLSGDLSIGIVPTAGSGALQLVEGTTAADGIKFGGDTNLYRSAANLLKTDDGFEAGAPIIASRSLAEQVRIGINNGGNAAIAFGTAEDTNLYRSAANTLKTDDSLVVGVDSDNGLVVEQAGGTDVFTVDTNGAGATGVTIGGGTQIEKVLHFAVDVNPAAGTQNTAVCATAAVAGAATTDTIVANPDPADVEDSYAWHGGRVSSAGNIEACFISGSAVPADPGAAITVFGIIITP